MSRVLDEIVLASHASAALSAFSDYVCERQRWLLHAMRALIVGDTRPATQTLPPARHCLSHVAPLPKSARDAVEAELQVLDAAWRDVVAAAGSEAGSPLYRALDAFQCASERFMRASADAHPRLRQSLALIDADSGALTPLLLVPILEALRERAQRAGGGATLIQYAFFDAPALPHDAPRAGAVFEALRRHCRGEDRVFRLADGVWLIAFETLPAESAPGIARRVTETLKGALGDAQQIAWGMAESNRAETVAAWLARAHPLTAPERAALGEGFLCCRFKSNLAA
jgi:hypothetical protein